ncbi:MAG: hypothetical protein IPJ03_05930 [Ignavibacteriales bacterium]|nr:hypothetical protein [Ignavibacteriales bacterium]
MKLKFIQIVFLPFLLISFSQIFAQQPDTTKPHINYRRTGIVGSPQSTIGNEAAVNNSPPPTTSYTQLPKEQVFPLGYGTNHLGKVNSGTGKWTELNPKVPRVDYLGIHFVNADIGWAVGAAGALIKTTDGGKNWLQIYSGSGFNNLFFLDSLKWMDSNLL